MFFIVYTYSVRYPYAHESAQIRFVSGFRQAMKYDNMDVPVMMPSVRRTWQIAHIILFIITGGLSIFYLLFIVYRSTNNHLYNQWSYEIRLMDAIIHHEGGSGIMAVKEREEGR